MQCGTYTLRPGSARVPGTVGHCDSGQKLGHAGVAVDEDGEVFGDTSGAYFAG